jgi:hypothetical protein
MANQTARKPDVPPSVELKDFFDPPQFGPTKWPEAVADWVRLIFVDAPFGPGRWAELTPDERCAAVAKFENEWSLKRAPERKMAWLDITLDAAFWWQRASVSPHEAASLLCQFNPLDCSCDPLNTKNEETGPDDYNKVLRAFDELHSTKPALRRLQDWLGCAKDQELKYHSWIDDYAKARTEAKNQPEDPRKGLTTRQIADIFDNFVAISLKSAMDDGAGWIAVGRVGRGSKGGRHKNLWDPILVATAIQQARNVSKRKLDKAFENEPDLKPWLEKWREYSTM